MARRGHGPESFRHLALEPEVARPVGVGDAVAEVDHGIGARLGDEAPELREQRQRRRPLLGEMVVAVMDIGDEHEPDGGHEAVLRRDQRAARVMRPARKSSTYGMCPGSGFQLTDRLRP